MCSVPKGLMLMKLHGEEDFVEIMYRETDMMSLILSLCNNHGSI